MKTKDHLKNKFDAVAFMRKRRQEIAKEIAGMTPQQEIEYFKAKAKDIVKLKQ